MAQIKSALSRQYLDPREAAPPPVFREGVMQLSDARVGMELMGTVRNVVDFGWFVDCGLGEDGLLHSSAVGMAAPPEMGEVVRVVVESVDVGRGRVRT